MGKRKRIALTVSVVSLVILFLVPTVPMANPFQTCFETSCASGVHYESLLQLLTPVCCDNAAKTIEVTFAVIHHGSASSIYHRGIANLAIVINNPSAATNITSIQVTEKSVNSSITVFQCPTPALCSPASRITIAPAGNTAFNSPSTVFYFSQNVTYGATYNFIFSFANGRVISGSLTAK